MVRQRLKGFCFLFKQKLIDYWFGSVYVGKQYVYGDWPEKKRLNTISIIPSLHKKGAWFSDIGVDSIENIVDSLGKKPKFKFQLDYGCGAFIEYTFNKYQQSLLLQELKNILESEILYIED